MQSWWRRRPLASLCRCVAKSMFKQMACEYANFTPGERRVFVEVGAMGAISVAGRSGGLVARELAKASQNRRTVQLLAGCGEGEAASLPPRRPSDLHMFKAIEATRY